MTSPQFLSIEGRAGIWEELEEQQGLLGEPEVPTPWKAI